MKCVVKWATLKDYFKPGTHCIENAIESSSLSDDDKYK